MITNNKQLPDHPTNSNGDPPWIGAPVLHRCPPLVVASCDHAEARFPCVPLVLITWDVLVVSCIFWLQHIVPFSLFCSLKLLLTPVTFRVSILRFQVSSWAAPLSKSVASPDGLTSPLWTTTIITPSTVPNHPQPSIPTHQSPTSTTNHPPTRHHVPPHLPRCRDAPWIGEPSRRRGRRWALCGPNRRQVRGAQRTPKPGAKRATWGANGWWWCWWSRENHQRLVNDDSWWLTMMVNEMIVDYSWASFQPLDERWWSKMIDNG